MVTLTLMLPQEKNIFSGVATVNVIIWSVMATPLITIRRVGEWSS